MTKPGTRVIAMSHTSDDKKTIYIFGYGVYEGHFNYGDVVSTEPSDKLFCGNPRIKLDNGKYVWVVSAGGVMRNVPGRSLQRAASTWLRSILTRNGLNVWVKVRPMTPPVSDFVVVDESW